MLQSKLIAKTIREHIESCKSEHERFDQQSFWKLQKRIIPTQVDPPMAKLDALGNLVTTPNALKTLYLKTYVQRLAHRQMKHELHDIFLLKTQLWNMRMQSMSNIQTPKWNLIKLDKTLSNLKNNKSVDPNGMVNEVFKTGTIGSDLKLVLLHLLNGCKEAQKVPKYMTYSNITSIYKNKGSRLSLENDRGIFIQTTLKKILDQTIYSEVYEDVDKSMGDSNIGARKERNIRDHLFIL